MKRESAKRNPIINADDVDGSSIPMLRAPINIAPINIAPINIAPILWFKLKELAFTLDHLA